MGIDSLISVLQSIGLTPQFVTPLIIVALVGYIILKRELAHVVKPFINSLNSINKAIVEIQSHLTTMGRSIMYPLTEKTESPLSPTDYGLQIYAESGLKKIVQENTEMLLKMLEKKLTSLKIITSYDVQEKSIELFVVDLANNPLISNVKEYAFSNGLRTEIILRVGALILRDDYFKKFPHVK